MTTIYDDVVKLLFQHDVMLYLSSELQPVPLLTSFVPSPHRSTPRRSLGRSSTPDRTKTCEGSQLEVAHSSTIPLLFLFQCL
jgi:hypothetical protein